MCILHNTNICIVVVERRSRSSILKEQLELYHQGVSFEESQLCLCFQSLR